MSNRTRLIVAFLVVVGASVAIAAASGALTIDTETANTATQSNFTDSTVITEPHNGSITNTMEIDGGSEMNNSNLANPETAMTLKFVVNDSSNDEDGDVLFETTKNWTVVASSSENHYNVSVDNDQWGDDLQYGAGDNVTVDARAIFNESESDEAIVNATFTVDPDTNDTLAWLQFNEDERETEAQDTTFLGLSVPNVPFVGQSADDPGAAKINDSDINVTDNTDEIVMNVDNENATDAFAEVADAGNDGDLSVIGYAAVDDTPVPLFVEDADADWLDEGSESYAVVNADGTEVRIHNVNATYGSSTSSVDVFAVGNDKVGFQRTRTMLSERGAGLGTQIIAGISAQDGNGDPFDDVEA